MTPEQYEQRARRAGRASQTIDTYVRTIARRRSELTETHREVLRRVLEGTAVPSEEEAAVLRLLLPAAT